MLTGCTWTWSFIARLLHGLTGQRKAVHWHAYEVNNEGCLDHAAPVPQLDYQLGRQLPQALTRPQPTADSDDGGDDEEEGSGGMDEEGGVLVDVPEPPPQGPALDAVRGASAAV